MVLGFLEWFVFKTVLVELWNSNNRSFGIIPKINWNYQTKIPVGLKNEAFQLISIRVEGVAMERNLSEFKTKLKAEDMEALESKFLIV